MKPTAAERIRAQAKEATRRALLEAGLAETIEGGGEVPSIETICSRAGYTRGAFYVYFKDREQFVAEMLDWVLNDIIQSLFATATQEAADLQEVVTRFNDALSLGEWPDLHGDIRAAYLAVLRELRPGSKVRDQHSDLMQEIARRLTQLVRQGQKAGDLRDDVKAADAAMLLLLTAIGAIMWDDIGIRIEGKAIGNTLIKLLRRPG